jgi:hypothetical protein
MDFPTAFKKWIPCNSSVRLKPVAKYIACFGPCFKVQAAGAGWQGKNKVTLAYVRQDAFASLFASPDPGAFNPFER